MFGSGNPLKNLTASLTSGFTNANPSEKLVERCAYRITDINTFVKGMMPWDKKHFWGKEARNEDFFVIPYGQDDEGQLFYIAQNADVTDMKLVQERPISRPDAVGVKPEEIGLVATETKRIGAWAMSDLIKNKQITHKLSGVPWSKKIA